jgi:hypothetical protein
MDYDLIFHRSGKPFVLVSSLLRYEVMRKPFNSLSKGYDGARTLSLMTRVWPLNLTITFHHRIVVAETAQPASGTEV